MSVRSFCYELKPVFTLFPVLPSSVQEKLYLKYVVAWEKIIFRIKTFDSRVATIFFKNIHYIKKVYWSCTNSIWEGTFTYILCSYAHDHIQVAGYALLLLNTIIQKLKLLWVDDTESFTFSGVPSVGISRFKYHVPCPKPHLEMLNFITSLSSFPPPFWASPRFFMLHQGRNPSYAMPWSRVGKAGGGVSC